MGRFGLAVKNAPIQSAQRKSAPNHAARFEKSAGADR
jgi:hypothetical protein